MRRRLDPEDQAIFGMLLADIDRAEVAATLGISQAGLDSRVWAMLNKLEGLGSDAVSMRPFGAPSIRAGRRR
jgi:hypothetical protein